MLKLYLDNYLAFDAFAMLCCHSHANKARCCCCCCQSAAGTSLALFSATNEWQRVLFLKGELSWLLLVLSFAELPEGNVSTDFVR